VIAGPISNFGDEAAHVLHGKVSLEGFFPCVMTNIHDQQSLLPTCKKGTLETREKKLI
jgi:hypothetical protein